MFCSQPHAPRTHTRPHPTGADPGAPTLLHQRLTFLDALRGIAALSVFFYHAGVVAGHDSGGALGASFHLGNFGVILFFLCSGFIIPAALEQSSSLRAFWIRRIARLYPPYWLSVAVYAALGLLVQRGESVDALLAAPLPVVIANLSMFQLLFDQPHLNYGYWTLLFELLFYVLATGLFAARLLRRTALVATVMCSLAIVVEVVLPVAFGTAKPVLGLVSFLATMFLGTVVYRLHTRELRWRSATPVLAFGTLMLATTALSLPAGEHGVWGFLDYLSGRVLALAVFLVAFALRARRVPRLLLFLGQISYSVYLLHMAVIMCVASGNTTLDLALWTVGTLVLAACSYQLIERPAIQFGRHLTQAHVRPLTTIQLPERPDCSHAEPQHAPLR